MASNASGRGGMGLGMVAFLIFLVLKLTNTIAWSWWWVTAPLWGGLAVVLVVCLIGALVLGIATAMDRQG